uniref:Radial spoke head protein 9 homolog n=1 Tax=Echinococcus granulosus TaxID=6210 RepID=A0A068WVR8_ECHGR|nr:radial spoke head 9 [Echinococcus granulosus]
MDCSDLHIKIDYLGSCGIVLTPEQKASLQTSLTLLRYEQKYVIVNFWGIIKGVQADYYIAQGIGKDYMSDITTLYSKDCITWCLLPIPTKYEVEKSKYFKMRFTGDPQHEFKHTELKQSFKGDELVQEETQEEDRLAAVIKRIDHDVQVIPRGSFHRLANGQVIRNKNYEGNPIFSLTCLLGLTTAEAAKLSSYLHFRRPLKYPHKPLEDKVKLNKATDFLDTLETDVPSGCWAILFERGNTVVYVKSLQWLGYILYHVPEKPVYGSLYVGCGEHNINLPFML